MRRTRISGRASDRRLALRGSFATLLAACALGVLADAGALRAQPGGDLPEQLQVIADVRFRGNKHLGKKQLKEARLKTHDPSRLPWRERPTLRLDYLRADTASLTALYRHYGYLDARAHWVIESTSDPEAARVVFVIQEGARSKITEVKLEGVREFRPHEITRSLLARPKRAFDPAFLALDTLHIGVLYQEHGHRPHTAASYTRGSPDSLAISVTYRIDEGPRYTVGRIDYEGLGRPGTRRVRESLARRELLLKPGETFRRSYLERSVQRLYDTGLYSQVQVSSAIDTSQAKLDMLLRVSERKSRWVDLGIGSGSVDLLRFTGSWGNRNLDHNALQGSLSGELTMDQQRTSLVDSSKVVRVRYGHGSANLVEPWLFGLRLQGNTGVFYEGGTDDRDPRFLQRRDSRGVEAGLSREFSNIFKGNASAHSALVHQSYEPLVIIPPSTLDSLSNFLTRYYDNGLALSLFRDTRDDRITPGRGSIQALVAELAGGPLKGASSFRKLLLVSNWYTPRANGWTIATRFSGGVMGPTGNPSNTFQPGTEDSVVARVPRERRFFIGGVNSMRGFNENSILRDGGLAMLLLNVEARIPLRGPFGAEAYVDIGNVWSRTEFIQLSDFIPPWEAAHSDPGDLRYTAGLGARLLLPFGPLRMDVTWSKHPEFTGSRIFKRAFPFNVQFAIGPSF
ncbi:MAG TPA: BamA/TamA family outer membrane protein [Methylomirabilota bacterium]|nr:BamA/TamA family outer membrane protein [Methylomirabilota bacterium]